MANAPLTKEQCVFLQTPGETAQRILHPATVKEIDGGVITAVLEDEAALPDAGQDALVYYEHRRVFMQQSVRIDAAMSSEEGHAIFAFEPNGDAVSAESRECYRVSLVLADYHADFGDEKACKLTDVSATGFSVLSTEEFSIGDVVDATLYLEGEAFNGAASVQSVKDLGDVNRYGLHAMSGAKGGTLSKGVQRISMHAQRAQLRRLSGAG